jgi:hypothetical protein
MWSTTNRARLRRVIDAFVAAVSLTSGLAVLLPPLVAIGVGAWGWLAGHSQIASVALGAAAGVLSSALIAFTVLHPVVRRLLYGYRFERLEILHQIDDEIWWRHHLRIHIHLRVIRTGLRIIQNRYTCSAVPQAGSEAPSHRPRIVAGAHEIFGPVFDNPSWIYWILLGGALSSGQRREISVEQDLCDAEDTRQQRISKTVTEPIDHLVLRVRVPEAMWPVEAEAYERIPGQDRARSITLVEDAPVRELRLIVHKPTFGREYSINWTMPQPGAPGAGVEQTTELV